MKRLSFIFLLVSFSLFVKAQFIQIAEGPVFPEPVSGISKLVQMKNGNTMLIHINPDTAWHIQVYEAQYKARTETYIEPSIKSAPFNIGGIFEIKNDVVVFIGTANQNELVLNRLIIDGTTGKLKEDKQVAAVKLGAPKKSDKPEALPWISVQKDPASEHYAILMINPFVSDTSKRVAISLYGDDNKEIGSGFYASSTEKYKYLQFVDMAVMGNDKVAALVYGYNIKEKDEKQGELLLCSLNKGSKTVVINELNFSSDLVIQNGIVKLDPVSGRLLLLFTAQVKSEEGKLGSWLCFIDPATKTLLTTTKIPGEKLEAKYATSFGKDAEYNGVAQNLFINSNQTFTIIFEEMQTNKEKGSVNQSLKNMAVVTYDNDVDLKSAYFIPMDHYIYDNPYTAFYQSVSSRAGQVFLKGNQYKPAVYISDGHNSFVMFNDLQDNVQALGKDKVVRLNETYEADAYYALLEGTGTIPKRQYMFGRPADKGNHKPAIFPVYDYDEANNLLVVLKTEREGGHPGVKLVWLQP